MALWRPFDVSVNTEHGEEKAKQERMKIRVGEREKEIVMDAYMQKSHEGWAAVLNAAQKSMQDSGMNSRLQNFYFKEEDTKVVRRIQRIVREESKKQAELYQKSRVQNKEHKQQSDAESGQFPEVIEKSSTILVEKQMRYAKKKTPEARRKTKFSVFVDSDEEEEEEEGEPLSPPKKKKTVREASLEAQNAHKEMCQASMQTMGMMASVLKALEKKLNE